MKDIGVIALRLVVICAVAAISLGVVNALTEDTITMRKAAAVKEALSLVSQGNEVGEETLVTDSPSVLAYYPMVSQGKVSGYVFRLKGKGYGGEFSLLAGLSKEGEVLSVVMMENQETPGLGKEAEKPEYMKKFIGKGKDSPIPVKKSQLKADDAAAITGATVTFSGIGKALSAAQEYAVKLSR
ncbi:MAG TPA: FMN-binding protein [Spirochaetia bacterium]|nr:FMN-binding protein [Spirochaetia bacterium]